MRGIDAIMRVPICDYDIRYGQLPTGVPRDVPARSCAVERASMLAFLHVQGLGDSVPYAIPGCFIAPIDFAAIDEDASGYLMA